MAQLLDNVSDVTAGVLRSGFVNDVLLPGMSEEDTLAFADWLENLDSETMADLGPAWEALSSAGGLQREAGTVAMLAGMRAGALQAQGKKDTDEWRVLDAMSASDWSRAMELSETGTYKLDSGELENIQRYSELDVNVPGFWRLAKTPTPIALVAPFTSAVELGGITVKQEAREAVDEAKDALEELRSDDGDGEGSMPPLPPTPDPDTDDDGARARIISAVIILTGTMGAAAAVATVIGLTTASGRTLESVGLTRDMLMDIARAREAELAEEQEGEEESSEDDSESEDEPDPDADSDEESGSDESTEDSSGDEQESQDPRPGYRDEPLFSS